MSRLEDMSVAFRKREMTRNSYNSNDEYNISNPNALSDGDEKGKGELNDSVGGLTDIKTRQKSMVKNKYNANDQYDSSKA